MKKNSVHFVYYFIKNGKKNQWKVRTINKKKLKIMKSKSELWQKKKTRFVIQIYTEFFKNPFR